LYFSHLENSITFMEQFLLINVNKIYEKNQSWDMCKNTEATGNPHRNRPLASIFSYVKSFHLRQFQGTSFQMISSDVDSFKTESLTILNTSTAKDPVTSAFKYFKITTIIKQILQCNMHLPVINITPVLKMAIYLMPRELSLFGNIEFNWQQHLRLPLNFNKCMMDETQHEFTPKGAFKTAYNQTSVSEETEWEEMRDI
ncbi:hypothetical protein L9F63_012612, partial [Diploptera punctata]